MNSLFHSRVLRIGKAFRRGALPMLSVVLCLAFASAAWPQPLPWSQRAANSAIHNWPTGRFVVPNAKWGWNDELAVLLNGMDAAWYDTADGAYYQDAKRAIDPLVEPDARGETVMVDAWFNSQQRQNAAGQKEYFHYKWNDHSDSGFSIFGQIFASHGATLDTLYEAPTADRLKHAQVYIIVSPDNPAKNPHPHYVQPEDADHVAEWVKRGGVLLLMENDPANADITHLNLLAERFGIHFDEVLKHHIIGEQFAPGYIPVSGRGLLFQHPHTLYMKDTCAISLKAPATVLLQDKAGIVMATAKYGKGTVFAVVDPWLYNEYTDPRKALPRQDNFEAGKEFVSWLLKQVPQSQQQVRP
jgi:unsaturated rhamnogalacturonyl hydrolase